MSSASTFKYRAFISYSHADRKSGVWLHKKLEAFRTPRKLVGRETAARAVPKRLGRVYRDETEEGAAYDLGERIERALVSSDTLIVVCSPKSAQSKWVNQEIVRFKQLGRAHRIFALIVEGEPHAADPAEECFTEAMKFQIGEDGALSDTPTDPLAVDIRKFGRDDAVLRLASGILDIDYDDLKQRDLIRRRAELRRAQALFVGGLSLVVLAAAFGVLTLLTARKNAQNLSLLFAERAKQSNDQQDYSGGLLWAVGGLPVGGEAFPPNGPDTHAQLLRSYHNDRLIRTFVGTNKDAKFSSDGALILTRDVQSAYLWNASTGEELFRLDGHENSLSDAEFSPDDKTVVTTSHDGPTRLWDASSGREFHRLQFKGDWAQFSENDRRVLIAHAGRTAGIWDVKTGNELVRIGLQHGLHDGDLLRGVELSPDGRIVLTRSTRADGGAKVILWDAETGTELTRLRGLDSRVLDAQFSADSKRIVTASLRDGARVWDATTGEELAHLDGHTDYVLGARFDPSGARILSWSEDRTVRVWNSTTGVELARLIGHADLTQNAEFSPDGRRILTASLDSTARVWDATTGAELAKLGGHQSGVNNARFDKNTERVLTVSDDGTARLWDAVQRFEIARLDGGHQIRGAALSPDSSRILTMGRIASLWDVVAAKELASFETQPMPGESAMFSPNGLKVLTLAKRGAAQLWDARTGQELIIFEGHQDALTSADFDSSSSRIITGSEDGTARIWDANSGRELALLPADGGPVSAVHFSPGDSRAITLSGGGESLQLWDASSGKELSAVISGPDRIFSARFYPDGHRLLLVRYRDAFTYPELWDASDGLQIIATIDAQGNYLLEDNALQLSPDGALLLTVGRTGARLWDATTGAAVARLGPPNDRLLFGEFSPDGSRVLIAGFGVIQLWDTSTRKIVVNFTGHRAQVTSAKFSKDRKRVLSAAFDEPALIWDAATGAELARLEVNEVVDRLNKSIWGAEFNENGDRLLTWSGDGIARVWGVRSDADIAPFLAASLSDQIMIACDKMSSSGNSLFYGEDRRSPILSGRSANPCNREGLLSWNWWREKLNQLTMRFAPGHRSFAQQTLPPRTKAPRPTPNPFHLYHDYQLS